jgi:hypothetical protein
MEDWKVLKEKERNFQKKIFVDFSKNGGSSKA